MFDQEPSPRESEPEELLRQARLQLERQIRGGAATAVEDLLRTFPSLASRPEWALELVYAEMVLLEELGRPPSLQDWQRRFPKWEEDLDQLWALHQYLQEQSPLPTPGATETVSAPSSIPDGERPSARRLGNYELLEEIGRGGMGVVYRARQLGIGRIVAIKMIFADEFTSPDSVARFRFEAEALGRLQHPNLVQVYEIGQQDRHLFLSQEFVEGGDLQRALRQQTWDLREAAELVATLCRAVQHAHDRGIIHRDLKPANILLTGLGAPKIADFGLARRLSAAPNATGSGRILGTPGYLAPEQLQGSGANDPACDIYSLGAILYALMTGRPPFQSASVWETLEQARTGDPEPPRRIRPEIPRDLETITLKCLDRDPSRRYRNAMALADDLKRFLGNRPIEGRRVGLQERVWRWGRREPLLANLLLVLAGVILVSLVTVTVLWRRAEERGRALKESIAATNRAREREATEKRQAEASQYPLNIRAAYDAWERGRADLAHKLLALAPRSQRGWEAEYLAGMIADSKPIVALPGSFALLDAAANTDGEVIAAASPTRVVLLDSSGRQLATGPMDGAWLRSMAIERDAETLWVGAAPLPMLLLPPKQAPRLPLSESRSMGFSGILRWRSPNSLDEVVPVETGVYSVSLSEDGTRLAGGGFRSQVFVVATDSGQRIVELQPDHAPRNAVVALSPDGHWLAVGGSEHGVKILDVERETESVLDFPTSQLVRLAWSPDQRWLAAGGRESPLRLWDFSSGTPQGFDIVPQTTRVAGLHFSPDARRLLVARDDLPLEVWDVVERVLLMTIPQPGATPRFLPRTAQIATLISRVDPRGQTASTLRLWDGRSAPGRVLFRHNAGTVRGLVCSPDGGRLVILGRDQADVRELPAFHQLSVDRGEAILRRNQTLSPDGRYSATLAGGYLSVARISEAKVLRQIPLSAEPRGRVRAGTFRFSPDGRYLVWSDPDHSIPLFDLEHEAMLANLRGHSDRVLHMSFHPSGNRLISAGADETVRLWSVSGGQELLVWKETSLSHVQAAEFSPDGKTLWLAGEDRVEMVTAESRTREAVLTAREDEIDERVAWHAASAGLLRKVGNAWGETFHLDRVLRYQPHNASARRQRYRARAELGLWGEAEEDCRLASEAAPADWHLLRDLGMLQLQQGRFDAGQASTVALLQFAEQSGEAAVCNEAAWNGILLDPPLAADRVLALARIAVEQRPSSRHYRNTLGFALLRTGRVSDAIVEFHAASQLDEHGASWEDCVGLALAYARLADLGQSWRYRQSALAAAPSNRAPPLFVVDASAENPDLAVRRGRWQARVSARELFRQLDKSSSLSARCGGRREQDGYPFDTGHSLSPPR